MSKIEDLQKLREEIELCSLCKSAGYGKQVFGEGNPNAKIMFVGEAPGKKEAESGRPFIGRSGQLLRKIIKSVGFREEDMYITSPVKFLPKGGTPTKKEITHSNIHFQKQLQIINPQILVLLGKTAIHAVLDRDIPILKDHGKLITQEKRNVLVTLHPAAVLRFPKYSGMFIEDFKKLKELVATH